MLDDGGLMADADQQEGWLACARSPVRRGQPGALAQSALLGDRASGTAARVTCSTTSTCRVRHRLRRRPGLQPHPQSHEAARAGFVPSKGDMADLDAALDKRPNQVPLIDALQSDRRLSEAQSGARPPQQQPSTTVRHRDDPVQPRPGARSQRRPRHQHPDLGWTAACSISACASSWCAPRTAGRCCWSATCSTTRGCGARTASRAAYPCS